MKIQQSQTLVMIGDSITDTGRTRPYGEGGGLGTGYVSLVDAFIGAVYADRLIRVLNTGSSGNTVRDLKGRWQTDVIDLKPDWVSVMIGTNDVWRQFDALKRPEVAVHAAEFEHTYSELITSTLPKLKGGMVLMTPFYVEPYKANPMRARMDEYGEIVRRIAKQNNCLFVDTQAAIEKALGDFQPGYFAGDRVHPNIYGCAVLARAFLKAIDFEF